MKILELRFKNLNSLYGEWFIDFTDPEYVGNGIFVLTGPTGAGKSTVLDAICLALYGATPRLGKITKSANHIMSRQTGECYAEVVFESRTGRFRCHWEQRRARKKADGNLQDQEHQIADADTGKPMETKKSLVSGVIEEKTGMDFDRFTRSILLAQGGFDTFLKADVEQKSKILEQITGTQIYSQISQHVHERQRSERDKLNLLLAETSGIVILEPEQEKEIQQDLEAKQNQEAVLATQSTQISKAIAWRNTIDALKKEISNLAQEAVRVQKDVEAFRPERDKLDQAMKAALLDGIYATLTALRKQQSDDQAAQKTQKTLLPELEKSAHTLAQALTSAEQHTLNTKADLKAAAPFIRKIRFLDQKLAEQRKAVVQESASCIKDAVKIDQDTQVQGKEQKKQIEAKKTLADVEAYLKAHAQDEWLISGLAGIEEQFASLVARQKEITEKQTRIKTAETALARATDKLNNSTKQCAIDKQNLADAVQHLEQGKDALNQLLGDRLLREYRTQKETLLREMAYLRKVEALEEYRARLEDGKPCPLCGAVAHPFARANVPAPDKIEKQIEALTKLITKAEDQEGMIRKQEEAKAAAQNNLNNSEKLEATALSDQKTAQKTLAELKETLLNLQTGLEHLSRNISDKLKPLGYTLDPVDPQSTIRDLKSKIQTWQDQVRKKAQIEKQIADIDSRIKRLDAVMETQRTALTQKQEHLEQLKKEYAAGLDERKKHYGDKHPDHEEDRMNKAIADAETNEKKSRILNSEVQQKLTTAKAHIESLKKRIEQREADLKKASLEFSAALEPVGFAGEAQFLGARLTNEKREALFFRAKKLDTAQTDLAARQKDRETQLETQMAIKLTDKSLEELETQFNACEASLKELRDTMAGLKHRLSENRAARERIKEKQAAITAQKKECSRFEKLHGLIGSADGKKFRNFAQGLTFELMVAHANGQLEKMTDRYLLIRDDEQPLELNVVDNYQAGEIRSTRNLSGGESFIVSLTLALGLSKMASRKVRVDSLFLDEGFGTLDEETLETALETLSGLQQDGKLIGIISHVSALKERIRTRINIIPVSGGRSLLSGPGCRKVDQSF